MFIFQMLQMISNALDTVLLEMLIWHFRSQGH